MKESKYNLCLQDHTGMVIYNAKADEVIALNPQLAAIYEKGKTLQTLSERNTPNSSPIW